MPINNIQAVGDDQRWKNEAEKKIAELERQLNLLTAQFNARNQRIN